MRARERTTAFFIALLTAAIAFEPRIRAGGFSADDWPDYAAFKFPQVAGAHSSLAALEQTGGTRVGHMLYWFISFSLFGNHSRLYTATAAMLAICLAFSVYLLLRELRFSITQSLAMMLLTIVAPSVDTVRFWFTVGGLQICLSLFCLGLALGVRAFAAPKERRLRLHAASWGLYLASAMYAETALALIAVSILIYMTRASLSSSLRRWTADMVIVVAGYAATLVFVSSRAGFGKLPASMWPEHANLIAGEALTILTKMLGPLSANDRTLGLACVGALSTACLVLWRRGNIAPRSRRELQRWGITFLISLVAIAAGYAVFVPAMLYYEPLGLGLATHINAVTAIPLATLVFSVLMLSRIVWVELLDGWIPRVRLLMTAIVAAWFGVIAVGSLKAVRSDAHVWALAATRNSDVLHTLATDLPRPVTDATIYTFGEAGTVAVGLPIFYTSWEQNSAVKVAYNRPDVSSYPIVVNGIKASCTPSGIIASVEQDIINKPSPYGESYFFDDLTGRYERIVSEATCAAGLSQFHAGPYVTTPQLSWSLE